MDGTDEIVHWPEPCLLLSSTCNEILSWMMEFWIRNHLVSGSNCNTVNLQSFPNFLHGLTNNVRLSFSVGDTTLWFTI